MEKLDKIYGHQISFETVTQKLLKEVLWSKGVAGKKEELSCRRKSRNRKEVYYLRQKISSFLSPHTNQAFKPLHLIQKKNFGKEEKLEQVLH